MTGGLGIAGGLATFSSLSGILSTVVSAAAQAERAQIKLRTTLQTTGNSVEGNIDALNGYADSMRDVANVDDDAVRGLIAYGLNLGVTTDKIREMTSAAIGLAEVTGDTAEDAMEKLVKANQGHFTSLEKQLPLLKKMQSAEERLAYVQKIGNQGLQQRRAQLEGAAGATERLKFATGELAEDVGGGLSPSLARLANAATSVVNAARTANASVSRGGAVSRAADALAVVLTGGMSAPLTGWLGGGKKPGSAGTAGASTAAPPGVGPRGQPSGSAGSFWNSGRAALAGVIAQQINQTKMRPADDTLSRERERLMERIPQVTGAALAKAQSRLNEINQFLNATPEARQAELAERFDQRGNRIAGEGAATKDRLGTFFQEQLDALTPPKTPLVADTNAFSWMRGVILDSTKPIFRSVGAATGDAMAENEQMRRDVLTRFNTANGLNAPIDLRRDAPSPQIDKTNALLQKLIETVQKWPKQIGATFGK